MKFRNFSFFIIICFLFVHVSNAQQLTTNENGEKILVFPDGSWKYAEDENMDTKGTNENPVQSPAGEDTDSDLEIAIRIAELTAAEESEAIRLQEDTRYERLLIEDELENAESNEDYLPEEIGAIKVRLKSAKKEEKSARSNRKDASKRAAKAAKLLTMNPEQRAKELNKYDLYHTLKSDESEQVSETFEMFPGEIKKPEAVIRNTSNKEKMKPQGEKVFAKYDPDKDVRFNPPKRNCKLSFDGIDEFSGKKRKDVEKQLFFNFTNEELRSVYKDRDYMTCNGYLSSLSGGMTFLTLNITIFSNSAQREYGILEKGSQINIKLINGENVKLMNSKTNMGTKNPLEGSVSYRAQYVISAGDEKKLKKSEVDKVRIIWSSGYEDYEIYELDFFMDQFKCLD